MYCRNFSLLFCDWEELCIISVISQILTLFPSAELFDRNFMNHVKEVQKANHDRDVHINILQIGTATILTVLGASLNQLRHPVTFQGDLIQIAAVGVADLLVVAVLQLGIGPLVKRHA